MIRKIIHIDEEKCNGCGACANACHEGAIDMVNGKAKLMRENFCDGFGDCLPSCPTGAITFEEREAPEYDEKAVKAAQEEKKMNEHKHHGGCPGSRMMTFEKPETEETPVITGKPVSRLNQYSTELTEALNMLENVLAFRVCKRIQCSSLTLCESERTRM